MDSDRLLTAQRNAGDAAMSGGSFAQLPTSDEPGETTSPQPKAVAEALLDQSIELKPMSPSAPGGAGAGGDGARRAVDEDAKIAQLKSALSEGDTQGLRDALADVTGLSLPELRVRRQMTMDPRSWVSPEGGPRVPNEFTTPLSKLIIASDVRLERWENADIQAQRQAEREKVENHPLVRFLNRCCGCCQEEKRLAKPRGAKPHNQHVALQKKRMLGRTTLDDIDIPDFYQSPAPSPLPSPNVSIDTAIDATAPAPAPPDTAALPTTAV